MKRIVAIAAILTGGVAFSQNLIPVNPNQNLIAVNPAFAGSNGGVRYQAACQSEWLFSAYRSALDFSLKKLNAGIAVSHYLEKPTYYFGSRSGYAVSYAQRIQIPRVDVEIAPFLQLAYHRRKVDFSRSSWVVPYPQQSAPEKTVRKEAVSASAGFNFRHRRNLTIGAGFFHINQPDEGISNQSTMHMRSVVNASYNFFFGEKHILQLTAFGVHETYSLYGRMNVNMLIYKRFMAGVGVGCNNYSTRQLHANVGYHARYFNVALSALRDWSYYPRNEIELQVSFNLRDKENRGRVVAFENM